MDRTGPQRWIPPSDDDMDRYAVEVEERARVRVLQDELAGMNQERAEWLRNLLTDLGDGVHRSPQSEVTS
jgi:hypothetical protein